MERKRWETAIRCLEIAVHPNTANEEVIAAVNGFRRTANSTPLIQVCREFASSETLRAETAEAPKQTLDRLTRENFELRQKIEEMEDSRTTALRRLAESEQRVHEIGGALLAAKDRADAAEQRLAAVQGGDRLSGGLRHETFDVRHAFDEARRNLMQPIHEPVPPFQRVLNAALQRPDQPRANPPRPSIRQPWTA